MGQAEKSAKWKFIHRKKAKSVSLWTNDEHYILRYITFHFTLQLHFHTTLQPPERCNVKCNYNFYKPKSAEFLSILLPEI